MKMKLSFVGMVIIGVIGWSCGAQVIGQALVDAGTRLVDAGVAHAQTGCTWQVRRFSLVNASGTALLWDLTLESGWEPFAALDTAVVARRCQ